MTIKTKTGKQLDDELRVIYNAMMERGGTTTKYDAELEREWVALEDLKTATLADLKKLCPMAASIDKESDSNAMRLIKLEERVGEWANKLKDACLCREKVIVDDKCPYCAGDSSEERCKCVVCQVVREMREATK